VLVGIGLQGSNVVIQDISIICHLSLLVALRIFAPSTTPLANIIMSVTPGLASWKT
jgi:hypothetical protein